MVRPTIKDISKCTGVSPISISRILRGTGRESEKTSARVLAAAAKLGYRPNGVARAMRRGSFGAVGLLRSTEPSSASISHSFLWAIEHELLAHGLHLVMGQVPDEKLTNRSTVPRLLGEWSVDGLLVNYTAHAPEKMLDLLAEFHLPSVWLNLRLRTNCVYPDDFRATHDATAKLLSMGHRRIAYLGKRPVPGVHYSILDRLNGYCQAMDAAAAKSTPELFEKSQDCLSLFIEAMRKPKRPTAVVAYSEWEATVAIIAAARLGLELPRDLSLIAIRHDEVLIGDLDVSTMSIPLYDMAPLAVDMLRRRIAAPEQDEPSQGVLFREYPGATCAPPLRKSK